MEFSDDIVFTVLNFLRENSDYSLLSFHYTEIPGGYSNQQIDFHLRYCRDNGFVEGQLSGDKIMALAQLTPEGLRHLQTLGNKTPQVVTAMEQKAPQFPEGSTKENEENHTATKEGSTVNQDREGLQVFISHSGEDFKLAKPLADLIQKSFRLSHDAIRCTSVDGYRLPGGISTDERLRIEVHDARLLIGLITPNSLNSQYVTFELGARWGADKPMIPLLAAGVTPSHLERPLSGFNALRCDNSSQVTKMIEDLAFHLETEHESISSCSEEINQLAKLSSEIARESDNQHLELKLEDDEGSTSANVHSIRSSWDAISLSPSQQTIDSDPRFAVIKLCAYLTSAIDALIRSDRDYFGARPPNSAKWRIEKLYEAGIIDRELASISYDLIGSRNALAHGQDLPIHSENLRQFTEAAKRMESIVSTRRM